MNEIKRIWGIIGDGEIYASEAMTMAAGADSVQTALLKYSQAQALALLDIAKSLRYLVTQNSIGCDGDLRTRVTALEVAAGLDCAGVDDKSSEYRPGLDEERARA